MSHDPGSPKPSLTTKQYKSKRGMWKFVKDIKHRLLMILDRSSKLTGILYTDHILGMLFTWFITFQPFLCSIPSKGPMGNGSRKRSASRPLLPFCCSWGVEFFVFNQRISDCSIEHIFWNMIFETNIIYRWLFWKAPNKKNLSFAKTSCFAPWKTPPPVPPHLCQTTPATPTRGNKESLSRSPIDPRRPTTRPTLDHVVRCNKPRRRKLFKGLKRHGVKSTPGTKTWKTP